MSAWDEGRRAGEADARDAFLAVGRWSDRPPVDVTPGAQPGRAYFKGQAHAERADWMLGYASGFRAVARRIQIAAMS